MAGGTLYEAIGKDRSGKLGWYNRCAPCARVAVLQRSGTL
jgi:hypothetical protein